MSRSRLILLTAGAIVFVLALAQVLLPRIAAGRIRSRLGRYGRVESVQVSAWPAIELLWGDAGSIHVRTGALSLSTSKAESLLWEARHAGSVSFSASAVKLGTLRLTGVSFSKHASQLEGQALASAADVRRALPAGVAIELLRSEGGEVEVRVQGSLFGIDGSLNALAMARDGRLVVKPTGLLLSPLELTLFSDPHVYVEGVGASADGGEQAGYRLSISALLH
jgi:hypothetical protein